MNYQQVFCDSTIKVGKPVCLTATGSSMWPVITCGMKAEIVPLDDKLPQRGEILLVRQGEQLLVHRFWRIDYKEGVPLVVTKGDANLSFDPPVTMDQVLGRVTLLYREKGLIDPNRGLLGAYGRFLCSSLFLARLWARLCRVMMVFIR